MVDFGFSPIYVTCPHTHRWKYTYASIFSHQQKNPHIHISTLWIFNFGRKTHKSTFPHPNQVHLWKSEQVWIFPHPQKNPQIHISTRRIFTSVQFRSHILTSTRENAHTCGFSITPEKSTYPHFHTVDFEFLPTAVTYPQIHPVWSPPQTGAAQSYFYGGWWVPCFCRKLQSLIHRIQIFAKNTLKFSFMGGDGGWYG